MTRQEFEARYQLLRPLDGEAHRTHLARGRSGAIVMVHFLDGRPSEWADGRLANLEAIEPSRREKIIDLVDDDHSGAVVTRFLMDFHSFADWMGVSGPSTAVTSTEGSSGLVGGDASGPGSDPPPRITAPESSSLPSAGLPDLPPTLGAFPAFGSASATPDSPAAGPGEFTQAFLAPVGAAPSGPVGEQADPDPPPQVELGAPPAAPPAEPEPSRTIPEPEKEMGEFTRAFRARVPSDEDVRDSADELVAMDLPSAEVARAGEGPTVSPVAPEAPPASFVDAEAPPASPVDAEAPPPSPFAAETQPEVPTEMGEFTRAFRASALPGPTADRAIAESESASHGDVREAEAPPPAAITGSVDLAPPDAPAPAVADGGNGDLMAAVPGEPDARPEPVGEFTRMFQAQRLPETPAGQPPIAVPEESPATHDKTEPAPAAGAGEFTRAFRGPSSSELETPAAAPPTAPPAADEPSPPSTRQPGEFTQMFRAQTDTTGDVGSQAAPELKETGANPPPAPTAPPPPPKSGEGEFTKMFRSPSAPAGHPATPASPPSVPYIAEPPPAPSGQPGEFTRAMRSLGDPGAPGPVAASPVAPRQPSPPAQPPAPPPSTAKGEFTTMFEKLAGAPPPPPAPPTPLPPAYGSGAAAGPMWPSSDPATGDDRYRDRLFNAPVTPPQAPPPPPAAPRHGGVIPVDPELPPLPAQMAPPPPPPTQVGGEYTRMISTFAPPPTPPPGAPYAAPPGSPPPGGALTKKAGAMATAEMNSRLPRTGLLLGFGAIGFSALALILYLVMKSVMMPATTETEAATDSAAPAVPAEPSPAP